MKKTLAVILVISLVLLAAAFGLKGITQSIAQKEHVKLMQTLLPDSKDFVKLNYTEQDGIIRSVHKASNGYVIETLVQGYADGITMLIGVANDGTVMGLVTYRAHETLGLGSKILTDHVFLSQFLGKSGSFTVDSSENDAFSSATDNTETTGSEIGIDGITGATVSSKAVVKCVNAAVAYVTGADIESSATEWGG